MTPTQHTYLTARAAYDTASAACESECPEYPGEDASAEALDAYEAACEAAERRYGVRTLRAALEAAERILVADVLDRSRAHLPAAEYATLASLTPARSVAKWRRLVDLCARSPERIAL